MLRDGANRATPRLRSRPRRIFGTTGTSVEAGAQSRAAAFAVDTRGTITAARDTNATSEARVTDPGNTTNPRTAQRALKKELKAQKKADARALASADKRADKKAKSKALKKADKKSAHGLGTKTAEKGDRNDQYGQYSLHDEKHGQKKAKKTGKLKKAERVKKAENAKKAEKAIKQAQRHDEKLSKQQRKQEKKQQKKLVKAQDKIARQAPLIQDHFIGVTRAPGEPEHLLANAQEHDPAKVSKARIEAITGVGTARGAGTEAVNETGSDPADTRTTTAHPSVGAGPTGPVIATTQGKVEGIRTMGVRTWRGIAFGRDTSGAGRFRAPHPADPWRGVRPAGHYGPVALQPTYGPADRLRGSEDCLNLDIVRPDTDEQLPVVVYFHGGSFIYGSSHEQLLRGHYLAESMNVVYVAINFRLGALGYLDMRAFGDDCVATPAIYDQLLALRWIRENIAAFGGDPHNVTVMGESAGGAAVLTLMCVPAAKGLFHKAIAQSPPIATIHSTAQSRMWASGINRRLGLGPSTTLSDLRCLPAGDLVRAGQSMLWRTREIFQLNSCFAPTVDNRIIHDHPLDVFAHGHQHKIPLLVGTNGDEASFAKGFYLRQAARGRAAERMLVAFDPEGAPDVLAAYSGAERRTDFAELLTDAVFWAPAMRVANAHAMVADTWMYRFDFAPAILRWMGLGAMHSTELTPVFGDMTASRMSSLNRFGGRESLLRLRDEMQYHWSQFIHHSVPGPAQSWPRYVAPTDVDPGRATKVFDAESRIVYDPNRYRRRAWRNYDMREWGAGRPELLEQLGLNEEATRSPGPLALPPSR